MVSGSMMLRRRLIVCLLVLTVALAFIASYVWENGGEKIISLAFGWPYETEFEDAEKWRFIVTSTSFAAIAQIIPGIFLTALVARLSSAFQRVVVSEEKTRILALHDPLTGLANRRQLQERMEEGFRPKVRYKLLLIDLDRFKAVNDDHGHSIGDQLLIKVAERILTIVGPEACAARLGGDEMAVLCYGDLNVAHHVAGQIVTSLNRPFQFESATVSIGCSIGMCCTDDATSPEELMKRADLALYEAKKEGGGHIACYQSGMLETLLERRRLEADIRVALVNNEFHLVYQPLFDLTNNNIFGYEALIRWDHPKLGPVPPVTFIPLAEETGQIIEIGEWVLREACQQAALWPAHQHVAVNISPVQFRSPLLLAQVAAALSDSGLIPKRLEVELTETAMVEDGQKVAIVLSSLRTLGVTVAMDDFGTGYSSLAHLRDFPLDRIKIDRSFVATAETDQHSLAVIRAITQIGRDLDIKTLGEGVETTSQLAMLHSLGCNAVQGYVIGKPERMDILTPSTALNLA